MAKDDIGKLAALIQTVHRLRAPGGCPWDRAQTHQSLRPYLIEEAYEVLDVLDLVESTESLKEPAVVGPLKEELGDLLMQVLLHSEMTDEVGAFNFYDVAEALNDKLIRRHPHVFGEAKADSAAPGSARDAVETAFQTWEKQKAKEKSGKKDASVLDGVPKGLPSLQRAARVIEKVTKVGFQWSDLEGPIQKLEEELGELKAEIRRQQAAPSEEARAKVEGELGDLIFSLCNVGTFLKVNPEDALRSTLRRFENRFKHVETRLKELGKTPEESSLEEMDGFWNEAKARGL